MIRYSVRKTAWTAAALAVAALLPAAASAQGQSRQRASNSFTTATADAGTGLRLSIDYFDPARPGGKPYAVQEVLQTLHPGARIDTSVPPRCEASDGELMAQGESACPQQTRVGGGSIDADTGMAVGSTPRVIENRAVFFNAPDGLILFTESTNAGEPPIRTVGRARVGERTLIFEVPPVPGTPPPDPFLAIKRARVTLDAVSAGGRSFIRTPPSCPASGRWTNTIRFTYRDGVRQLVESASPCRRAGDRRPPRIRALGIPSRRCASRAFRPQIRIGEHTPLRSASVALDGRVTKRTRKKHFRVRVPVGRLRPGRHALTVRATDRAGNRSRRTFRFRRCR